MSWVLHQGDQVPYFQSLCGLAHLFLQQGVSFLSVVKTCYHQSHHHKLEGPLERVSLEQSCWGARCISFLQIYNPTIVLALLNQLMASQPQALNILGHQHPAHIIKQAALQRIQSQQTRNTDQKQQQPQQSLISKNKITFRLPQPQIQHANPIEQTVLDTPYKQASVVQDLNTQFIPPQSQNVAKNKQGNTSQFRHRQRNGGLQSQSSHNQSRNGCNSLTGELGTGSKTSLRGAAEKKEEIAECDSPTLSKLKQLLSGISSTPGLLSGNRAQNQQSKNFQAILNLLQRQENVRTSPTSKLSYIRQIGGGQSTTNKMQGERAVGAKIGIRKDNNETNDEIDLRYGSQRPISRNRSIIYQAVTEKDAMNAYNHSSFSSRKYKTPAQVQHAVKVKRFNEDLNGLVAGQTHKSPESCYLQDQGQQLNRVLSLSKGRSLKSAYCKQRQLPGGNIVINNFYSYNSTGDGINLDSNLMNQADLFEGSHPENDQNLFIRTPMHGNQGVSQNTHMLQGGKPINIQGIAKGIRQDLISQILALTDVQVIQASTNIKQVLQAFQGTPERQVAEDQHIVSSRKRPRSVVYHMAARQPNHSVGGQQMQQQQQQYQISNLTDEILSRLGAANSFSSPSPNKSKHPLISSHLQELEQKLLREAAISTLSIDEKSEENRPQFRKSVSQVDGDRRGLKIEPLIKQDLSINL
ncbi:hypothetical protein FGO68_gene1284 [Halteria grandinella]|uniref:Uncharacterized protein n=1 Tax=Halteria grandinella TaxID=5974 RepID=A0A8J8T8U3_HALGN|nr:hypothetical protein FGO68_gene1284 [Halteria grandinella]